MLHGPVVVPYGERVAAEHCRVHEVVVVDRIFEGAAAVGGLVECREGVAGLDAPQVYYAVAHLGERVCVLPAHAEPLHQHREGVAVFHADRVGVVAVGEEAYRRNLHLVGSLRVLSAAVIAVPAGARRGEQRQRGRHKQYAESESCHLKRSLVNQRRQI